MEQLWLWRDGIDLTGLTLGRAWLFPISYPLALAEALAVRQQMLDASGWDERWLPLFSDGAGDYFVADYTVAEPASIWRTTAISTPTPPDSLCWPPA